MSATTSKATLFRICSFLTLFLGFLTAFVGELVMLSLHLKAARITLYIACGAIIAGGIACLGARVPPTRPFTASATDSSAATVAPVCYYVFSIILSVISLGLTAALVLFDYDPQRNERLGMVLLLFAPMAYLAGCVFVGGWVLVQLRERGEFNQCASDQRV